MTARKHKLFISNHVPFKLLLLCMVCGFCVQHLDAQVSLSRDEVISLLDYIALESELTRLYNEDSLLLEDIYNRLENHLDPGVLEKPSRDYIRFLFNKITDFNVIDIRRERIKQIRDQARARAIQQAIPSPVFFLSLTNNLRDPVALIINVAGMAAQGVTSYLSSTEQAELQFFEANMELNIDQKRAVDELRSGIFNHTGLIATENGLRQNDTVSPSAIKDFVSYKDEKNLAIKLRSLLDRQSTYEKFFPYWLELANTYHQAGQFMECISAINRYEAIKAPIFRQHANIDYVETLLRGIDALSKIYQNNNAQYARLALDYLRKIEENAPDNHWVSRYGAALTYIDLASISSPANRREYLNKAFQLLRGNVRNLAVSQREMLIGRQSGLVKDEDNHAYLRPIPAKKLFQKDDPVTKMLRERRKVELPPYSNALLTNCSALYAVMDALSTSQRERAEIATMLNEALYVPVTRMTYLSDTTYDNDANSPVRGSLFSAKINNANTGKIVGRWVGGVLTFGLLLPVGIWAGDKIGDLIDPDPPQSVGLSFPVVFLGPTNSVHLKIVNDDGSPVTDDKKNLCDFEETYFLVKEVIRKNNNLNDFKIEVIVPLPSKVSLKKANAYRIELSLVSEVGTQNIVFYSPAGSNDFTEYKVTFQ